MSIFYLYLINDILLNDKLNKKIIDIFNIRKWIKIFF